MDIESLLNWIEESQVLLETSDKEIYQAIIEACDVMDINGTDSEVDVVVKPVPTQRELLKAISIIRKHTDDSLTWKICRCSFGVLHLATLLWRMKDSTISDLFKT